MRSYKAALLQGELVASPPEAVAAFLRDHAAERAADMWSGDYDEEIERALHARGDPLIDIALGRYGAHANVLADMFRAAPQESPIRLACLANQTFGRRLFLRFPADLFGEDEALLEWLRSPPPMEAYALFENPTIHELFLRDLLDREEGKPWAGVSDETLGFVVLILSKNPRMWEPYDDSHMDGFAEYTHNAVFTAAWELAEKVEPTSRWAHALSALYHRLLPS